MTHRKQITDRDAMTKVVTGGRATFTLVSKRSGTRFTFKARAPKKDMEGGKTDFSVVFISLLDGPDNNTDYTYIGQLFPGRTGLVYHHGKKSRVTTAAPSVQLMSWFFNQLASNGSKLDQVEFWHEGKCARCGRKLTVPESIDCGFGPECAGLLGYNVPKPPRKAKSATTTPAIESEEDAREAHKAAMAASDEPGHDQEMGADVVLAARYHKMVSDGVASGMSEREASEVASNALCGKCPDGCCGDEDGSRARALAAALEHDMMRMESEGDRAETLRDERDKAEARATMEGGIEAIRSGLRA